MFTGSKPFAKLQVDGVALEPLQIAIKVATEQLRPTIPVNCPQGLVDVIQKCWEQEPGNMKSVLIARKTTFSRGSFATVVQIICVNKV